MIKINLDFDAFFDLATLGDRVERATKELSNDLAMATVAFVIEKAEEKLHSTKDLFLGALDIKASDVGEGYELTLGKEAAWIEEGLKPMEILPFLLKSPHAKISKSGSKYINVPMNLNQKLSASSSRGILVSAIKSKIQQTGQSKSGAFDELFKQKGAKVNVDTPLKTLGPFGGIGQGQGEIGATMQGQTGIPFLQGLRIKGPTKGEGGKKDQKGFVGTFRVASSKQEGKGMWQHPGTSPQHIFKEAQEFMAQELIKRIRGGK